MKTHLQLLSERHIAEEQAALDLRAQRQTEEFFEDAWASQDPLQADSRAHQTLTGNLPSDILFYGAAGFHAARPGSRRDGDMPPFYRTEQQHWMIVDAARVIEGFCTTAMNVLDLLCEFIIFTGFSYRVVPRKKGSDKALADKANRVLEDWGKQVKWRQWEREIFRRTRRDGEAFVMMEPSDDVPSMPHLIAAEPSQVTEPRGTTLRVPRGHTYRYGILSSRRDTAKPIAYWVTDEFSDESTVRGGREFDAGEMVHIKTEWVDRQAKRGISDFFGTANDMVASRKLLRSLTEGATVQANIAYVKETPQGMQPTSSSGGQPSTGRSGDRVTALQMDGPNIVTLSHGYQYHPGPIADRGRSEAIVKVFQAGIRNIGTRHQFPEGMISADSSNANLASAVVAEAPMVKGMEYRQGFYVDEYGDTVRGVLNWAARIGMFGAQRETILDTVRLVVKPPPVGPRHRLEETQRSAVLYDRGGMSMPTWQEKEDLDPEEERENIEETGEVKVPEQPGGSEQNASPDPDNERRDNP